MAEFLDFDFLDDLALAVQLRGLDVGAHLRAVRARTIGPLAELAVLERAASAGGLAVANLALDATTQALSKALRRPREACYGRQSDDCFGFLAGRYASAADDTSWVAFLRQAQSAAEACGFAKVTAHQLIGALIEIEDNVHLHSAGANTALVAYRASPDGFEFCVADGGIGVAQSLRQNPTYAGLTDAGAALRLALSDGVSRFDASSGHGFGFRSLFVGLANAQGLLRFRSGDHALTIDGAAPKLIDARLETRATFQGFSAAVLCRAG